MARALQPALTRSRAWALGSQARTPLQDVRLSRSGSTIADTGSDALGDVDAGGTAYVYTLHNDGADALTVASVATGTLSNVTSATVSGITTPVVVAPGGSTTFTVTVTPTAAGACSYTLTVTSDDPDAEAVYTVSVSGTGVSAGPSWSRLTDSNLVSASEFWDDNACLAGDVVYSSPSFAVPLAAPNSAKDGVTEVGKYRLSTSGISGWTDQTGTGPRLLVARIRPHTAPASSRPILGLALVDSDGDGTGVGGGLYAATGAQWGAMAMSDTTKSNSGSGDYADGITAYVAFLVVGDDGIPSQAATGTVADNALVSAWTWRSSDSTLLGQSGRAGPGALTGGLYLDIVGGWGGAGTTPETIDMEAEVCFPPAELEAADGWVAFTDADIVVADAGDLYQNPDISGTPLVASWTYDATNGWSFVANGDPGAGSTTRDGPDAGAYFRFRMPGAWRGDGTQALLFRLRPTIHPGAANLMIGLCVCDRNGVATAGVSVGGGVAWVTTSSTQVQVAGGKVNDFDGSGTVAWSTAPVFYGLLPSVGPLSDSDATGTNVGMTGPAMCWWLNNTGNRAAYLKTDGGSSTVDGVYILGFYGQFGAVTGPLTIASHWEYRLVDVVPSDEYA